MVVQVKVSLGPDIRRVIVTVPRLRMGRVANLAVQIPGGGHSAGVVVAPGVGGRALPRSAEGGRGSVAVAVVADVKEPGFVDAMPSIVAFQAGLAGEIGAVLGGGKLGAIDHLGSQSIYEGGNASHPDPAVVIVAPEAEGGQLAGDAGIVRRGSRGPLVHDIDEEPRIPRRGIRYIPLREGFDGHQIGFVEGHEIRIGQDGRRHLRGHLGCGHGVGDRRNLDRPGGAMGGFPGTVVIHIDPERHGFGRNRIENEIGAIQGARRCGGDFRDFERIHVIERHSLILVARLVVTDLALIWGNIQFTGIPGRVPVDVVAGVGEISENDPSWNRALF